MVQSKEFGNCYQVLLFLQARKNHLKSYSGLCSIFLNKLFYHIYLLFVHDICFFLFFSFSVNSIHQIWVIMMIFLYCFVFDTTRPACLVLCPDQIFGRSFCPITFGFSWFFGYLIEVSLFQLENNTKSFLLLFGVLKDNINTVRMLLVNSDIFSWMLRSSSFQPFQFLLLHSFSNFLQLSCGTTSWNWDWVSLWN